MSIKSEYAGNMNKSVMTYIVLILHAYQEIRAFRYYHASSKCIYQFIWCKLEQNYHFPYYIGFKSTNVAELFQMQKLVLVQ